MQEKIEQCVNMLKYLNKPSYTFKCVMGGLSNFPLDKIHYRQYRTFTFYKDGTFEYIGTDHHSYDDVLLTNFKPTQLILDQTFNQLKGMCKDRARGQVMQRLINHQFKYNGLEFLVES